MGKVTKDYQNKVEKYREKGNKNKPELEKIDAEYQAVVARYNESLVILTDKFEKIAQVEYIILRCVKTIYEVL